MPKNIVICCDGTGNQIDANLSNVLKAYRVFEKNDGQIVFYDPGVGTLSNKSAWSKWKQSVKQAVQKATGIGLDQNVLDAYIFLMEFYEPGDQVYLFGFSRGAYTVRVLAGFLCLVGLLRAGQKNLAEYAFASYKEVSINGNFDIAWRFEKVTGTQKVPIRFIGVWDTVSSVLIPHPNFLLGIKQQTLPYTSKNPCVETFRQAIAIDERRRMFRINRWTEPQIYKPNPFSKSEAPPQDIKQVWFAGCHSDVGGGYAEEESGLAKFPLKWMLDEAKACGLQLNTATYNRLVLGHERKGSDRKYVAPDATAQKHNSLSLGWWLIEWWPRGKSKREWPKRLAWLIFYYFPFGEPRLIEEDAFVHQSVVQRIAKVKKYKPVNIPKNYVVVT